MRRLSKANRAKVKAIREKRGVGAAMEISGHRTRATFDRYNITSEQDLREALVKTSAYVESLPTKPTVALLRKS